jgi:hypothetical protein
MARHPGILGASTFAAGTLEKAIVPDGTEAAAGVRGAAPPGYCCLPKSGLPALFRLRVVGKAGAVIIGDDQHVFLQLLVDGGLFLLVIGVAV